MSRQRYEIWRGRSATPRHRGWIRHPRRRGHGRYLTKRKQRQKQEERRSRRDLRNRLVPVSTPYRSVERFGALVLFCVYVPGICAHITHLCHTVYKSMSLWKRAICSHMISNEHHLELHETRMKIRNCHLISFPMASLRDRITHKNNQYTEHLQH